MVNRVDDAARLFSEGKSCSQAVFAAFAPELGVDEALALRLASGLGGGMRIGGACGAATGAVLALGLRHFDGGSPDDRAAVTAAVEVFYERFVEAVGATDCIDILECDVRSPEGRDLMRERGLRESRCLHAVRSAAVIVDGMLRGKG